MSTVWMFAGHGAQYPGMGRTILRRTEAGRGWLRAAERASGLALGERVAHGPARALSDPLVLELLLAVVSGAYVDLLRVQEGPPAAVAAYSAGHVAALYAAGVVDRETCLAIAAIRGAELARAAEATAGGMLAVHGLPEAQLVLIAEDDATDPVSIAGRNTPMHVTYSGTIAGLARAAARATHAGAITSPLDTAGPWHSPLLEDARAAIERAVAGLTFAPARLPVWSSVTAHATRDPQLLRRSLAASVTCTVEWDATVNAMLDAGIDDFLEVSPGRTLWGLLGQIAPPQPFARRYLECPRGPARRGAVRHHPELLLTAHSLTAQSFTTWGSA